jgi:hypothetical protein
LSTAREEEERGKEEWRGEWSAAGEAVTGARRGDGATIQEPSGCHVEEGGARVGEEEEKRKREPGRRQPTKPELLCKDTDAVNPEDRSASAAMDALNVDHHLFGRIPEQ